MGNFSKLSKRFLIKTRSSSTDQIQDLSDIYTDLIEAIEDDNEIELEYILSQHDISITLDRESLGCLLLKACEFNRIYFVEVFLKYGANVNHSNNEQSLSCLMIAAKNNYHQLLRMLIEAGVKISATDSYNWTALFYASYFGSVECARILTNEGAQVNLADNDEMTCLMWAAGRGHKAIVELLLINDARVNQLDRYNTSALIWACRKGHTDIAELLVDNGSNIDERGMYGWTPLIVAVMGEHSETVKLLLEHGANTDICDGEKMSPLMISCRNAYKDVALDLIKNNAFVNQTDSQGNTPLIYAAKAKCAELVYALLQAGANIEQPDLEERNAVHWSIIRGDIDSFRLFLNHGLDTTLTTNCGETYLLCAVRNRSWDMIKLMNVYSDTQVSGVNKELDSLIDIAKDIEDNHLIEVLLSKSVLLRRTIKSRPDI